MWKQPSRKDLSLPRHGLHICSPTLYKKVDGQRIDTEMTEDKFRICAQNLHHNIHSKEHAQYIL